MTDHLRPAYAAPIRLSRWLLAFLVLDVLLSAVAVITGYLARLPLVQLRKGNATDAIVAAVLDTGARHNLVSLVHGSAGVVLAILFLVWVYRVAGNAHALTVKPMRFTRGSAVWWYFVPIFNLFRPYQAFFEVWTVSADPDSPYRHRRTDALALWWFLWLLTKGMLIIALILLLRARENDIGPALTGNVFQIGGDLLSIPLSLVLIRIVLRLNALQAAYHERHHQHAMASHPAPAPRQDLAGAH